MCVYIYIYTHTDTYTYIMVITLNIQRLNNVQYSHKNVRVHC